MPATYLIGRVSDPLLGLFTGVLAYHLHEKNPRSRPAPGHTLQELASWQWDRSREARRARETAVMRSEELDGKAKEEWEALRKELGGEGGKAE